MKEYELLMVNKRYHYLVVATSYVNPVDKLYEIGEDLERFSYEGNVVFDLLLCNGMLTNRYLEIFFNGHSFEISKVRTLSDVDEDIKNIAYSVYIQNPIFLESSNLPKAQQYLLKEGMIK